MSFKNLRLLFIISIGLVLFIEFSPIKFPEIINGTSEQINRFLSQILYAYLTSFIFYYMVVYIKERDDRENTKEFVSLNIRLIYQNYKYLNSALFKTAKTDLIEFPSIDNYNEIFKQIDPNSDAPLIMGTNMRKADWFDLINHTFEQHQSYRSKLENLSSHLPTDLIKILTKADFRSDNGMTFNWFKSWQIANKKPYKDLTFSGTEIFRFSQAIKMFKDYHEKQFGPIK